MCAKLWDKGGSTNELMHRLTVGNDPLTDLNLVCADAVGSAAHARMLVHVKLLTEADCRALLDALREVYLGGEKSEFIIPAELEDVHTAIENYLTEKCGDAGKRIHVARSRNDQIVMALRLYLRERVQLALGALAELFAKTSARFSTDARVPLPGYTHMQPAMPASIGMWLHSVAEIVLELERQGESILNFLDCYPLGSGAGFGSSLEIDREYAATLLGFSRVQRSFIDVNNSRGRYDLKVVQWLTDIAAAFEKFACDCMLFSTKEFGFLSFPEELTTGSSIMPQKRNPDVVELLRGRAAKLRGCETELSWVIGKLPSSYHRDLQFTKEPTVRAFTEIQNVFDSVGLILQGFKLNETRLKEAMHPELYATYEANRQTAGGLPFRDAYKNTANLVFAGKLDILSLEKDFAKIQAEVEKSMNEAEAEQQTFLTRHKERSERLLRINSAVFDLSSAAPRPFI